nr:hypothetical protein [Fibrisoma limi]
MSKARSKMRLVNWVSIRAESVSGDNAQKKRIKSNQPAPRLPPSSNRSDSCNES